ncbi:MAG: YhbY family RNA-binding protein [Candidatus Thorarchaeota archaeon]|nr:MAG: YhbY family RNA-binding protein [Candidatus Thorarchaeota archaeon]
MTRKAKPDPARVGIAWQEPAIMNIGKGGVSDGLVKEAKRLLKKHKYIKVRLLRSTMSENPSKNDIVQKLCLSTGAKLVGIRGNTAVIYKI